MARDKHVQPKDDRPDRDKKGVPLTIDHWDDATGLPVYLHEVEGKGGDSPVPMAGISDSDPVKKIKTGLLAAGYPENQAQKMAEEAAAHAPAA